MRSLCLLKSESMAKLPDFGATAARFLLCFKQILSAFLSWRARSCFSDDVALWQQLHGGGSGWPTWSSRELRWAAHLGAPGSWLGLTDPPQ
jgi:hypothetical protein